MIDRSFGIAALLLFGAFVLFAEQGSPFSLEFSTAYHRVLVPAQEGIPFHPLYPDIFVIASEFRQTIRMGSAGRLILDVGAEARNDTVIAIAGQSEPLDIEGAFFCGVNDLAFEVDALEELKLSLGILSLKTGSSLYANPADFLSRYMITQNRFGSESFPCARVDAYIGDAQLSLLIIPYLGAASAYSSAVRLFNDSYPGNLLAASGSYAFSQIRLKIAGYMAENSPWSFGNYAWGVGAEAQVPIADWLILEGQTLVSTGLGYFDLFPVPSSPYSYLDRNAQSAGEVIVDLSASARFTLFGRVNFSLSYCRNGHGLSPEAWRAASISLDSLAAAGQDPMAAAPLLSFAAMAQYPLFYVRDYCIAAVEVPEIASGLSLVSMGYISLIDASVVAAIRLGYDIDDSKTAALIAQMAMGAKGTQFGLASDRLRLGIEFRFFL